MTKAPHANEVKVCRQTLAWVCVNAGHARALGRSREAEAWSALADLMRWLIRTSSVSGLPVQQDFGFFDLDLPGD